MEIIEITISQLWDQFPYWLVYKNVSEQKTTWQVKGRHKDPNSKTF